MTRLWIVLAAGLISATAVPNALRAVERPTDPFVRLFKNPVGEIKRLMREPPPDATPSPRRPATAAAQKPADAATATAPAAAGPPKAAPASSVATAPPPPPEPAAVEEVPVPRVRPAIAPEVAAVAEGVPAETEALSPAAALAAAHEAVAPPPLPAPSQTATPVPPVAPLALAPNEPAAVDVPLPRPRIASHAAAASLAAVGTAPAGEAPVRRPRASSGEVKLAALPPAGAPDPVPACAASLAAYGISAVPLGPITEGSCGVAAPAAVASLENGAVSFTTKAIVNCAVASALAEWLKDDVQPAAEKHLGKRVTGIRVAASYICRGRNNDPTAELSEHSFGNAIDISALKVGDKEWVEVGATKTDAEAAFLADIREDACGPFTTVLGPGVAYHDTHFHFDLAKRGRKGNSLYCR